MVSPIPLHAIPPAPPSLAERIAAYRDETAALAAEHVGALVEAMRQVERLAGEIATGGDPYPAGVRDVARRLGEDCATRATTIAALMERRS